MRRQHLDLSTVTCSISSSICLMLLSVVNPVCLVNQQVAGTKQAARTVMLLPHEQQESMQQSAACNNM